MHQNGNWEVRSWWKKMCPVRLYSYNVVLLGGFAFDVVLQRIEIDHLVYRVYALIPLPPFTPTPPPKTFVWRAPPQGRALTLESHHVQYDASSSSPAPHPSSRVHVGHCAIRAGPASPLRGRNHPVRRALAGTGAGQDRADRVNPPSRAPSWEHRGELHR